MEAKMGRHVLMAGVVMTMVICSMVGAAVVGPVYEAESMTLAEAGGATMPSGGDAVLAREEAIPASGAIALCACAVAVVGVRRPRTDVVPGVIRFATLRS